MCVCFETVSHLVFFWHAFLCVFGERREGESHIIAKNISSVHYSCISPIHSVCDMFKGFSVQCVLQNENGEKRDEEWNENGLYFWKHSFSRHLEVFHGHAAHQKSLGGYYPFSLRCGSRSVEINGNQSEDRNTVGFCLSPIILFTPTVQCDWMKWSDMLLTPIAISHGEIAQYYTVSQR